MKIIKIQLYKIQIPFRFKYKHAKTEHAGVSSVICLAYDDLNQVGLGEAVPRDYVTGESCDSVFDDIKKIVPLIINEEMDLNLFKDKIISLASNWEGAFPSCAFCAIEGAILNLFAKEKKCSLSHLFEENTKKQLIYTGSIGISHSAALTVKLLAYKTAGFKRFKIKVKMMEDIERLKLVRQIFGEDVSIYADANAMWNRETAVRNIEALEKYKIWAIEEPLKPIISEGSRESMLSDEHYQNYVWLKERVNMPIIVDESLISLAALKKIINFKAFDILNVRLSKCGGFILSSEMVKQGKENNLKFGIGAMVGETAILACEGAHFGSVHLDYAYIQGFSHGMLHQVNVAESKVKISRGGKVNLADGSDLDVKLKKSALEKVVVKKEALKL